MAIGIFGYYVDTVGKNAKKIQEYIQNQLKEDLEYDQMTLKEYIDAFTGEQVQQSKSDEPFRAPQSNDVASGEFLTGL